MNFEVALGASHKPSNPSASVFTYEVSAAFRGRGIGRAILEHLTADSRARNCS